MPTITRRIEFDAGHRVLGHEGKCANLHGHRYVAEVTVSAPILDDISRVIDFSVIKELVGGWINDNWDHNLLLNEKDPLINAIQQLNKLAPLDMPEGVVGWEDVVFNKLPYIMPHGCNPTAEAMAEVLYCQARSLLIDHDLQVEKIRLYETPNCWAERWKGIK